MENFLDNVVEDSRFWTSEGKVADYIPKLAHANKKHVAVCVYDLENNNFEAGDSQVKFSIQSVSKVFSLICALQDSGLERFLMKVDVEPSGDSFNSLIKLETMEKHRPLNPFINAGAIATVGMVRGKTSTEKFQKVIDLIRKMTDNESLTYNREIFESEKETGDTNKAIAYFLKGAGILSGNIDETLETYFKICSIEATVNDMAKASAVLANNGVAPWSGERVIDEETVKIVRTVMSSCGLYDGSGSFAVKVGIPAKSGVGGCIFGVVPNRMGIATFGPALDKKGNSIAGYKIFEKMSEEFNLSIF